MSEFFSPEWWGRVVDMIIAATKDFFADDGPQWAASIAYYGLLSIFPLLLAAASIAAFFVDPQTAIDQASDLLGDLLPRGVGEINQIVEQAVASRGSASVLSILALLWTGSRVFGTLTKALNIAYDVDESYSFFRRLLVELILLFTIGFLFIIAVVSRSLFGFLWGQFTFLPAEQGLIFRVLQSAIPGTLLFVTFLLVYLYVPRRKVDWKAALPGAVIATLLFLIARPLFLGYVSDFSRLGLIYGSLAIAIVIVLWAWVVGVILLFGGEIVSHIQEMLVEGKSKEEVQQRHLDRSPTKAPA